MNTAKHILVVEDSVRLNDFIKTQLIKHDYEVTQAFNGKDAYEALKKISYNLIVLDLKLGDIDGLSILKTIRLQDKQIPVMIISSISDDATKIEGFRLGCDDYLTKPFMTSEMLMRIKRMIERNEQLHIPQVPIEEIIDSGIFKINVASQSVVKNGVEIPMRKKYFDILLYFIKHPGVAIPYRTLYEGVWNITTMEESVIESNLYVNINALRKLIEDDAANPKIITSVRHIGYMYNVIESEN